jgi:hypothetical protein
LYDHGHTVNKFGVRGDARLQHHGGGSRREVDLARLEAVEGGLLLEHQELTKALAPHLRAYRPLRQVSVADVLTPLVHHPSPVGATDAEASFPDIGKQGIAMAALDQRAQRRVGGAHLLPPGRGFGD